MSQFALGVLAGVVGTIALSMVVLVNPNHAGFVTLERLAMADITTLHFAEANFVLQHGRAGSLDELAMKQWSNTYEFTLTANGANYTVRAKPRKYGTEGRRTFYSDQTGIIHEHWGPEPADASSPLMEGGVSASPGRSSDHPGQ